MFLIILDMSKGLHESKMRCMIVHCKLVSSLGSSLMSRAHAFSPARLKAFAISHWPPKASAT